MSTLIERELQLSVDQVLRGQGADPAVIRGRNPRVVAYAERALEEARPLLRPRVLIHSLEVEELHHEQLRLSGGARLKGALIGQHMGGAEVAHLVLCTIGDQLEARVSQWSPEDLAYALAIDGVGSAAIEVLANSVANQVEFQAIAQGKRSTIPLSPGMIGWSVGDGQPQLFKIFNELQNEVQLSESSLMEPRKSLTFLLGVGKNIAEGGKTCDFCSLKETCNYQSHYQPVVEQGHG
jgi:hypothetical protein